MNIKNEGCNTTYMQKSLALGTHKSSAEARVLPCSLYCATRPQPLGLTSVLGGGPAGAAVKACELRAKELSSLGLGT
eukprot:6204718-Pleurochrysis_carterae.AAC.4